MLSSGVGRGLVCEASRVLSWLSLRAPGPQAVLCSSHMQMWLAGLSVDGTQARRAPACHAAPLASIRKMCRQVLRGSAGEYQADVQAGIARFCWRVSVR